MKRRYVLDFKINLNMNVSASMRLLRLGSELALDCHVNTSSSRVFMVSIEKLVVAPRTRVAITLIA